VTASDRREAIIDAAKDDARAAVDLLLDAIGRILLAHIGAHAVTQPQPSAPDAARLDHSAPNRNWTPEEDAVLAQHYPTRGADGVRAAGVNRSNAAITIRARTKGVRRGDRSWTAEEDALLARHFPRGGVKAVQASGVNRTNASVYKRAQRTGLGRHRPRTAPVITRSLTQQVLDALLEADARDDVLDAELLTRTEKGALRKLRRDNLATQEAPGLWRPTLKGIAQGRNATEPTRQETT